MGAFGSDRDNIFTDRKGKIRSFFAAAEPSFGAWTGSGSAVHCLYASGDKDPFDDKEDRLRCHLRKSDLRGRGHQLLDPPVDPVRRRRAAVAISGRNGILNSLRSSKEQGQSNFNNPGTILLGAGADFDILPELRLSTNLNHLWFANTSVLQALRNEGSIPKDIGWDISAAAIYRPKFTQNLVFRASAAVLQSGDGFRDLFANSDGDKRYVSILLNAILTF
jgi:hypothetical protein